MSAPGRFLVLVAVVGALAGCTKGGGHPSPTPSSTSTGTATPAHVGPENFQPGEYRYSFNNVTASLSFDGSSATLDVTDGSGADLAAPALYVILGTGRRVDGTVTAPAPIANGANGTFRVTFPGTVTAKTIGLVILLFGDSNYGAMAPVPTA